MERLAKGKKQTARLAGLGRFVRYPIGRMDIEYKNVQAGGVLSPEIHTLQLIITDHKARQLSEHFATLALELAQTGGSKQ